MRFLPIGLLTGISLAPLIHLGAICSFWMPEALQTSTRDLPALLVKAKPILAVPDEAMARYEWISPTRLLNFVRTDRRLDLQVIDLRKKLSVDCERFNSLLRKKRLDQEPDHVRFCVSRDRKNILFQLSYGTGGYAVLVYASLDARCSIEFGRQAFSFFPVLLPDNRAFADVSEVYSGSGRALRLRIVSLVHKDAEGVLDESYFHIPGNPTSRDPSRVWLLGFHQDGEAIVAYTNNRRSEMKVTQFRPGEVRATGTSQPIHLPEGASVEECVLSPDARHVA